MKFKAFKGPFISLSVGGILAYILLLLSDHIEFVDQNSLVISFLSLYIFAICEEFVKHNAHNIGNRMKSSYMSTYMSLFYACLGFFIIEQIHYFVSFEGLFSQNIFIFFIRCSFVFTNHIIGSFLGLYSLEYMMGFLNRSIAQVFAIFSGALFHFSVNLSFKSGYVLIAGLLLFGFGYFLIERVLFPSKRV